MPTIHNAAIAPATAAAAAAKLPMPVISRGAMFPVSIALVAEADASEPVAVAKLDASAPVADVTSVVVQSQPES